MLYGIPGETPEQIEKIEKGVTSIMNSASMKTKYTDVIQRKAHAVAIYKSQLMGLDEAKKGIKFAKNTIPYIRNELTKLKLSTDVSDVDKDIMRRKLILSAKKLGVKQLSDENAEDKTDTEENTEELTKEEKELTEEEMTKIEKELGIDEVELDTSEVKEMDKETEDAVEKTEVTEEDKKTEEATEESTEETSTEESKEKTDEATEDKTEEATEEETEDKKEEVKEEKAEEEEESKTDDGEDSEEVNEDDKETDNSEDGKSDSKESENETEESTEEAPKDVVEDKQELSHELFAEVRNELTKTYNDLKAKSDYILKLEKENQELKDSNVVLNDNKVQLSAKIDRFENTELLRAKTKFEEKILSLSNSYKKLGQDKSTEELSKLNISTITELENVVNVALQAQDDSVIVPSQAMNSDVIVKSTGDEKLKLSKADNSSFFTHVCKELETQRISGNVKINV